MIRTLAWAEGKRLVRSPAVLAGVTAAAWLALPSWLDGRPPGTPGSTQTYEQLTLLLAPLHLGAFIAGALLAIRDEKESIVESLVARPLSPARRTQALILAGVVPVACTAALVTVNWLLVAAAGGIPTGHPEPALFVPTVVDAVYVVSLTGLAYTAGIAFARTVPSRVFTVVAGVAITWIFFFYYWMSGWFPAYFLTPYASPISGVRSDGVSRGPIAYFEGYIGGWFEIVRDTDLVFWRAVYFAGLALLLAAHALRRSDRRARVGRLVTTEALLAVGGFLLQITAYSGSWALLGSWWE
ncbi:hypothetical protein ACQP2X_26730 [Actinoplanes sp. CA-131856]